MAEIYVSTDVETDGPIPGPHSMLSLGSAAFHPDGAMIGTFTVNLQPLEGATGHDATMSWWRDHPVAWEACRGNPREPAAALQDYLVWLKDLPGKPVFVAYPAAFDFSFVYWYLIRFTGQSPFSFSALDMKTYAMVLLGTKFHDTVKRNMPREWFPGSPHTHVALDDAIEQGQLFCNMLAERERLLDKS